MARQTERKGSTGSGQSVVDTVKAIAARNARADLDTEEQLLLFLQSWWSRTYNRPLKDPVLLSYSLEELLYEFYDRIERTKAEDERLERESDKIEDNKDQANLDWAEQEEKRELDALKAEAAQASEVKDPTKDPENVKWMEEQIKNAKSLLGDDFGEDLTLKFDE